MLQGVDRVAFLDKQGKVLQQVDLALPTPAPGPGDGSVSKATDHTPVPFMKIQDHNSPLNKWLTYFKATLKGPKGQMDVDVQFDDGSVELLLTDTLATMLGLPNLGNWTGMGVGGQVQTYLSQVDIIIGGVTYPNQPCMVSKNYIGNLFGARFWAENSLSYLVSPKTSTITIYKE